MQSSKINILVFHDRKDWPPAFIRVLNGRGFSAQLFRKPSECLLRVKQGLNNIDAVIIHKDLGQHVPSEWRLGISSDVVVSAIHDEAPFVRVGVVSGEYPDGTKHVKKMGADFYVNVLDIGHDWVFQQLLKGVVSSEEQAMRGSRVEMEDLYSRGG